MEQYHIGQVVRIGIPRMYGTIINIKEGSALNYWGIGLLIKFMKSFRGLVSGDYDYRIGESIYPLKHPIFGKTLNVIDPHEEIIRLEELKRKGLEKEPGMRESLDEIINFLRRHLPSAKSQPRTLESAAQ